MKDMTSVATSAMTDQEKAEIEKQMNSSKPNGSFVSSVPDTTPPVTTASSSPRTSAPTVSHDDSAQPAMVATESSSTPASPSHIVIHGSTLPPASSATAADQKREAARRRAEQREKLRELEKARRQAMEKRVATLTIKMIERLRPFVEAKDPGGADDSESMAFEEKMKREVEDLKLESFGVEVCLVFLDSDFDGR